jgi:hypothetical protein
MPRFLYDFFFNYFLSRYLHLGVSLIQTLYKRKQLNKFKKIKVYYFLTKKDATKNETEL